MSRRKRVGSLVIVGTGITGAPQTTHEAAAAMRYAGKLFYLALDPVTEQWIVGLNPTAESLQACYGEGKSRTATYQEMRAVIVGRVLKGEHVCVAFYGHPGVLVQASHWAIADVRAAGGTARMLPAVSAEACMLADLGVNPGDHGWQCHEATTFLLRRKRIDPTSELILWQIGVLGDSTTRTQPSADRQKRLTVLVKELLKYYPGSHQVTLYESATIPGLDPAVTRLSLKELPQAAINPTATLYVPAVPERPYRSLVARWLRS